MVQVKALVSGAVSPALLVQSACMYDCKISLKVQEKTLNAKSLLGMMSLVFRDNDEVEIIADGQDEEHAAAQMKSCFSASGNRKGA